MPEQVLDKQATGTARSRRSASTTRLLRRAIEERATLRLSVEADSLSPALTATITGGDEEFLELLICMRDADECARAADGLFHAGLVLDGVPYGFETVCSAAVTDDRKATLRIRTPATLRPIERRRTARHTFREPALVTMQFAGATQRCTATLLNLSLTGLACRVASEASTGVAVGMSVRADFQTDPDESPLSLAARVVTCTPAGTPGHLVLGMEFESAPASADDRERLRAALAAAERLGTA
ncbi:MAG: PilZ domain-containing protein [Planctomycetes bacterium]|nr:PilZ domain-containing protein [Planctomycetota bacterium]